ncbi:bacillithiol biosynthesis cysteine-adding enzyme BshC [Aureibacillus halotolerans]|uniref:Putative cysteine ligase BshC n=1 Tax=Aureibacillus halotolerans TaxID=1508390 RepID=A0A4R6U919_9BACI|nr:bacillithiol biosynthesis cysteine-adding enzyme BshC [Aureibacillus halotolerans]TDQ42316.1 bacillithiol biosynthesis cysteine-adding enzyme BshC [Aureibacillus halotolerans]
MQVRKTTHVQGNALLKHYIDQNSSVLERFDYTLTEESLLERQKELSARSFPRQSVARVLETFNHSIGADDATFANIARLQQKESLVVVCGQQAGFLTGPLFTIFKTISTIQWAKQQEDVLGVPVIPVFWIAGEDHDFPEINHLFVPVERGVTKLSLPVSQEDTKTSVAQRSLNATHGEELIKQAFAGFGETAYTQDLLKQTLDAFHSSTNYVDFFGKLMVSLFPGEGLVFLNAHDASLRELEAPFFRDFVMENEAVHREVVSAQQSLKEDGFTGPLELDRELAHLFLHVDGERHLLERAEDGGFHDRHQKLHLQTEDLLAVIEETPERVSNNVVSRPLMQEYLLPVLTFVAGPGELSYWSLLKSAFHVFGFKVPPLLPRMHGTIVDSQTAKWLNKYELSLEQVCESGVDAYQSEHEKRLQNLHLYDTLAELQGHYAKINDLLAGIAEDMPGTQSLAAAAQKKWAAQEEWLQTKYRHAINESYEDEMAGYWHLKKMLLPEGSPQDRVHNVFFWLNVYGPELIQQLLSQPFVEDHTMTVFEM